MICLTVCPLTHAYTQVDYDFKTFICDMGLVQLKSSATLLTASDRGGTPLYKAPESHKGKSGTPSDVWSFGLVMIEMFSGGRAWGDHVDADQIYVYKLRKVLPPAITQVPDFIMALCHSCILYDPKDRPIMTLVLKEIENIQATLEKPH